MISRDTVQGRTDLRGVIIPVFKIEETDDFTEETKPCHKVRNKLPKEWSQVFLLLFPSICNKSAAH